MSENSNNNFLFKFTWIIDNFSMYPEKEGSFIWSPEFIIDSLNHSKWYLKLWPKSQTKKFISCSLYRSNTNSETEYIYVDVVKIDVNDRSNQIKFSEVKKGLSFPRFSCLEFNNSIKNNEYTDDELLEKNDIIIQCFIGSENTDKKGCSECIARTKINFDRTSFQWIICDFDAPNFLSKKSFFFSQHEPLFEIKLNFCDSEGGLIINICKLHSNYEKQCALIARIALLNNHDVEEIYKRDVHWYDHNQIWKFPHFLKKSLLNDNKAKYLTNGNFKLSCEFCLPKTEFISEIDYINTDVSEAVLPSNDISKSINPIDITLNSTPIDVLIDDLKAMLNNNIQTDVTIHVGEDLFPAHKSILCTRSPVFCAMLQQNMSEKMTGDIKIDDMDSNVVKYFLNFLYTGGVGNINVDEAIKLLLAAEKYQVASLKDVCCSFLNSALNVKNVGDILLLADMLNRDSLKTSATEFIKAHASEILSSEEWLNCVKRNPELTTKITCLIFADISK